MISPRTIAAVAAVSLMGVAVMDSGAKPVTLRDTLMAIPVSANLGGDTTRPLDAQNAFSFPAANISPERLRAFSFGNRLFNTNWVEAPASVKNFDGLGPLFNRVSCSGCHTKDGRGQPPLNGEGPMDTMLFRTSGPVFGDQLSERAIAGVVPEGRAKITYEEIQGTFASGETFTLLKPSYRITDTADGPSPTDLKISARVAPQMIGLGLLEAVPDATLRALADPEDRDGDGISGRPNMVLDSARGEKALGRFGWKASQATLENQNAAAAVGDIGLTTKLHPEENCSEHQTACKTAINGGSPEISDAFFERLTFYTATLAVPAQRNVASAQVQQGAQTFRDMGCAACHMPTLQTGQHKFPELSKQTFHPYTDLLLHDMGEGLADERPDLEANGKEWRTPPLWGLGLVPKVNGHDSMLHDGRARGYAEAILWHGGEAEKSKENFRQAPKQQRDALIAFLKSL